MKVSKTHTGKVNSEATRKKMSDVKKLWWQQKKGTKLCGKY